MKKLMKTGSLLMVLILILFFSVQAYSTSPELKVWEDDMSENINLENIQYFGFVKKDENTQASEFEFANLPDKTALFMEDGSSRSSVIYKVKGADTVEVKFYSTYGTMANQPQSDIFFLSGKEHINTGLSEYITPIYFDGSRAHIQNEYGSIFSTVVEDDFFGIFLKPNYDLQPSDLEEMQLLGASVTSLDAGGNHTRIMYSSFEYVFVEDSQSPNTYLHTLSFQIPEDSVAVQIDLTELFGVAGEHALINPILSMLANVKFTGEDIILKEEESSESESSESSGSESSGSESESSESSGSESSDDESSESSNPNPPTIIPEKPQESSKVTESYASQDEMYGGYNPNFGRKKSSTSNVERIVEDENKPPIIYISPSEDDEDDE